MNGEAPKELPAQKSAKPEQPDAPETPGPEGKLRLMTSYLYQYVTCAT